MKRLLLFGLLLSGILIGCEDIQDNSPALQGVVNDVFFKANNTIAATPGNAIVIRGESEDQFLTLRLPSLAPGVYDLQETDSVYASFLDFSGNLYRTTSDSRGKIVISSQNTSGNSLSGTFNFIAYLPGLDTLVVEKGAFYEIRYDLGFELDDPLVGQ